MLCRTPWTRARMSLEQQDLLGVAPRYDHPGSRRCLAEAWAAQGVNRISCRQSGDFAAAVRKWRSLLSSPLHVTVKTFAALSVLLAEIAVRLIRGPARAGPPASSNKMLANGWRIRPGRHAGPVGVRVA